MKASRSASILLVEDDIVEGIWLRQTVEAMGFSSPFLVHSTDLAKEVIRHHQPQLIICDLFFDKLPKGLMLLQEFAERGSQFIMITSSIDGSFYEKTRSIGVGAHLVKPFHPITLQSTIDTVLTSLPQLPSTEKTHLFIRGAQNKQVRVDFQDIMYLYSERNYTFIKTIHGRHTIKRSLSKMLGGLDSRFIRVHNSYAVNIDYLKSVAASTLLVDKDVVPIGRSYRKNLSGLIK
ncbi:MULTISPECIES: LytR/AlgR family response regulator transcription factor [Spirosoma]|uniref:Response regulator transcription factor n=1 Tax=Spirosoma sordidisoli TaxID=2502893 RepID=A0A4Q2UI22_9BACT|nr:MULTISPECIES: LytTR family DNA-binding domain-containing protein [Spirosoma]RYC68756.1 response regulator transcription factor [Spirosoma sordidisoli]